MCTKTKAVVPETVLVQSNIVDITTVASTETSPAYLVDRRLLDDILSRIVKSTLYDIKQELKTIISTANDKDTMFANLDDYIYLNKVVVKLQEVEESNKSVDFTPVMDDKESPVAPYKYGAEANID